MSVLAKMIVNENIPSKDPFWNPASGVPDYASLDKVYIPSTNEIRQFQIEKIQHFTNIALSENFPDLDGLINGDYSSLISQYQLGEDAELNKRLESLFGRLTSASFSANITDQSKKSSWKSLTTKLKNAVGDLEFLINRLNANNNLVLQKDLLKLRQAIAACEIQSTTLGEFDLHSFLSTLNIKKGDLLEELGVAFFKQLNLANTESIKLGSVYLKTSGTGEYAGRHSGQLIQDLISYSVSSNENLELLESSVEWKGIDGKKYQGTLKDLFNAIEKANGQSKQIVIEDEAYSLIERLHSFNVQAKSGKNQLPWNKQSLHTQVSLAEMGPVDKLGLSIQATFKLLQSLNDKEYEKMPYTIKDTSPAYNAIANYGLATVMNKVLSLSAKENQYLLTPKGFMPFGQRVAELFQKEKNIALIQDGITLQTGKDILNVAHKITISDK